MHIHHFSLTAVWDDEDSVRLHIFSDTRKMYNPKLQFTMYLKKNKTKNVGYMEIFSVRFDLKNHV